MISLTCSLQIRYLNEETGKSMAPLGQVFIRDLLLKNGVEIQF